MAKKKKQEKKKPVGVQECQGFRVGDMIWYELVDGRIGRGQIESFSPNDSLGPSVCVYDEINSGYRSGLLEFASFEAPPKGIRALNRSIANRARAQSAEKAKKTKNKK